MVIGLNRVRHASTVVSLQYLRALAACSVMYAHIFSNRICMHWDSYKLFGASGVSTFFIISGFIMWSSTRSRQGGAWRFLKRRFLRVFPLWWMALTAWIVLRLMVPDRLGNADITSWSVIWSYLLVPHFHVVFQYALPILVPGWTLQLEIFFYVLLASVLFIRTEHRRLLTLAGLLVLSLAIGLVVHARSAALAVYSDPLLVEFLAGIALAVGLARLNRVPWPFGVALLATGAVLVARIGRDTPVVGWHHLVVSGVPALAIVAGALILEKVADRRPSAWLLLLGDASYSLYLTHPISTAAMAVVWHRLHLPEGSDPLSAGFIPVAFVASLVGALLTYLCVERPLIARLLPSRPKVPALPDRDLVERRLDQVEAAPAS